MAIQPGKPATPAAPAAPKLSIEEKVEAWIKDVLETQPHPDKGHLSTHMRAKAGELVASIKGLV